jgi:hypothetical protein
VAAVKATGRRKLIIAALWTEVCLAFPALCALAEGFEVYAVEDCSGGTSVTAHEAALNRITQAGGVRTTWVCTMLEWQRDWARRATYDPVMQTVLEVSQQKHSIAAAGMPHACLLSPRCLLLLLCASLSMAACTGRPWSTATPWSTRRRPSRRGWRPRQPERDTEQEALRRDAVCQWQCSKAEGGWDEAAGWASAAAMRSWWIAWAAAVSDGGSGSAAACFCVVVLCFSLQQMDV